MKVIKNECEEIPKDECMNDEDILNDIMLSEKNISNSYSVAVNEMSNKYLYKEVMSIFEDTKDMARDISRQHLRHAKFFFKKIHARGNPSKHYTSRVF